MYLLSVQPYLDQHFKFYKQIITINTNPEGKLKELEAVRSIIPDNISCKYITQSEPLGLGHAVLCAKSAVGNHPFALILPDDLIEDGTRGVTKQLVKRYEKTNNSIIAVENVCKKKAYVTIYF